MSDETNLVQCNCCERRCRIKDQSAGYCRIRYNDRGNLFLSVYGYPCALQIDPIEKKPLFHFLPGTRSFSIGTFGCNYRCSFCQNWSISQPLNVSCNQPNIAGLVLQSRGSQEYFSPQAIVALALENHCSSIAFTYNEPTTWGEYAHDIAEEAHKKGLKCIYVSNGSMTEEHLEFIKSSIDAMNIDLKAWNPDFYRKVCAGDIEVVKRNIRRIWKMGIWLEVTTLLIPGKNDSDMEIGSIAHFLADISPAIPWHISAFHPDFRMKDIGNTPVTRMKFAYDVGKDAGLKYVYLGNIQCAHCEDTSCPQCHKKVIQRNWFHVQLPTDSTFSGVCPSCGTKIDGIWQQQL